MAEIIRMPKMSDTMEEGVIAAWLKKVGDAVKPGDILAEVETDKATMELESYEEGVLLYIGVEEKNAVAVNGVIAIIGDKGENIDALLKEISGGGAPAAKAEDKKEEKSSEEKDIVKDETKKLTPEEARQKLIDDKNKKIEALIYMNKGNTLSELVRLEEAATSYFSGLKISSYSSSHSIQSLPILPEDQLNQPKTLNIIKFS